MGSPIFRNDQHFICTFHRVSREGIVSGDHLTEFQIPHTLYFFCESDSSLHQEAAEAFKFTFILMTYKLVNDGLTKSRIDE